MLAPDLSETDLIVLRVLAGLATEDDLPEDLRTGLFLDHVDELRERCGARTDPHLIALAAFWELLPDLANPAPERSNCRDPQGTLTRPATRIGWSAFGLLEAVPGFMILGMNAAGLALTGSLVADEFDSPRGLTAASVPDLEPHAEEQPQHDAANATAGISTRTYRYEPYVPEPAHQDAPLSNSALRGEGWS